MIGKSYFQARSFATKMMAGSTSNKKDSAGRRLGIKRFGQAEILENEIVARQRGFHIQMKMREWHPGNHMNYGKDHTLHANVEGVLGWSRDNFSRRKRSYIHVIPQEIPNRKFPAPPPFVYHPELFPELAQHNPEPSNFEIPKPQGNKRKKNPQPLKARIIPKDQVQRIEVKSMTPELFKYHGHAVYESYKQEDIENLQVELHGKYKQYLTSSPN